MQEKIQAERPYISIEEFAELHEVSEEAVRKWLKNDRLDGAYQSPQRPGGAWFIPSGCPRPTPGKPGRPKRNEAP